jgi:CspA family cold shock protein
MAIGTVKWFNNAKGYGFILADEGGGDLFAHYSAIQMDGYKTLKAGQSVEFEITEGPKGLQATNIQAPGQEATEAGEIILEDLQSEDELDAVDAANGEPATSEVISVTVEDPAPAAGIEDDERSEEQAEPKASQSN